MKTGLAFMYRPLSELYFSYKLYCQYRSLKLPRCHVDPQGPLHSLGIVRSANTNLLSVSRVRTAIASRGFSVAAPQGCIGTQSHMIAGIRYSSSAILSVAFLKFTVSSRLLLPLYSGSPKCLRIFQIRSRPLADIMHSE